MLTRVLHLVGYAAVASRQRLVGAGEAARGSAGASSAGAHGGQLRGRRRPRCEADVIDV